MGLPTNTAFAPSANALNASVPTLIPPSRKTSILPLTAAITSGKASICNESELSDNTMFNTAINIKQLLEEAWCKVGYDNIG